MHVSISSIVLIAFPNVSEMHGHWVVAIALGVVALLGGSSRADISNETPAVGSCLCIDGANVNVRSSGQVNRSAIVIQV